MKKIITQCPHCFNTLKNDYHQYGADFEVIHHSELIRDLAGSGRLKLKGPADLGKVVYHDSCYLGRYNGIFDQPRELIATATGRPPMEMERKPRALILLRRRRRPHVDGGKHRQAHQSRAGQ